MQIYPHLAAYYPILQSLVPIYHVYLMDQYANYLKIVFMNIN